MKTIDEESVVNSLRREIIITNHSEGNKCKILSFSPHSGLYYLTVRDRELVKPVSSKQYCSMSECIDEYNDCEL